MCAAFNLNLLFSRTDVLTITASISSPVTRLSLLIDLDQTTARIENIKRT